MHAQYILVRVHIIIIMNVVIFQGKVKKQSQAVL